MNDHRCFSKNTADKSVGDGRCKYVGGMIRFCRREPESAVNRLGWISGWSLLAVVGAEEEQPHGADRGDGKECFMKVGNDPSCSFDSGASAHEAFIGMKGGHNSAGAIGHDPISVEQRQLERCLKFS